MKYVNHRVNKISELELLDNRYGCEIDIRSNVKIPQSLHLSHDPWVAGDSFEEWIELYKKKNMTGPLILNTKEVV